MQRKNPKNKSFWLMDSKDSSHWDESISNILTAKDWITL